MTCISEQIGEPLGELLEKIELCLDLSEEFYHDLGVGHGARSEWAHKNLLVEVRDRCEMNAGGERTRTFTYIATCVIKIVERWRAGASIFLFSAHPSSLLLRNGCNLLARTRTRTFAHSFYGAEAFGVVFVRIMYE